jgi:phosphoglucosamine mutase
MKEDGTSIGGEQSGHIIFLDENTTGDGLLSGLHLLRILKESGKKMSELAKVMEVLPQALVNVAVPNDKKAVFADIPEVKTAIEELEKKYSGEGRVLIRPSGTEPLVRVMIEGRDKGLIDADAKALADVIAKAVS